jgi:DNA repair exonuclease SbcCD ATPase subunit
LFKQILGKVLAHVNEAFTETGKRRTGKGSPWTQIRDLIKQKEEYARTCNEQAQKSQVLETEIQQLLDTQLSRRESLDQAQGMLNQIEESNVQGRKRKEISARLLECKRALGEVTKASEELRDAEEKLSSLGKRHEELSKNLQAAQVAHKDAERQVQSAKEHLSRLQSDDASRERLLRKGVLEKRQAELDTEGLHLLTEKERASSVVSQSLTVSKLDEASRAQVKSLEALERQHAEAVNSLQKVDDHESELVSVSHLLKARAAGAAVNEAERGLSQVSAWRKTTVETRAQVEALRASLLAATVPASEELEQLRQLANDIQLARARVDVGLQAKMRAKRPVRVSVRRDGEPQTQYEVSVSPLEVNASREVSFDIEDLVEVVVSGGVGTHVTP